MKIQRFVVGGIGILLLAFGVRFALSQTGTTHTDAAPAPRMYADLSLRFSQEALVDEKEIERAITAALAKQNIAVSQVAVTRGESITIVFRSSEEIPSPVPRVRLSVGATNNPHMPFGVYNYGIGLSEIAEGSRTKAKPTQCGTLGVSSNVSLQQDVVDTIPLLIAKYDVAFAREHYIQAINSKTPMTDR